MKRLWTTARYKLGQRIRRANARRRATSAAERERPRRSRPKLERRAGRILVTAPTELRVFENPRATIPFCNQLRQVLSQRGARVAVDVSGVGRVDSDALLLMRAVIHEHNRYASVSGNLPTNPDVAAKFKQSDFFRGFAKPPKDLPPPTGMMSHRQDTKVHASKAAAMVLFAMEHADLSKEVADATYITLVELMLNTHTHADARVGQKPWLASVYCTKGTAYFTFIDIGVGILKSASPKRFLRGLGLTLRGYGEAELLRQVFEGRIGASTEIPGRGFGLTTMRAMAAQGKLPSLRVMTSGVVGPVAEMDFSPSGVQIRGTIFRWETSNPSLSHQ